MANKEATARIKINKLLETAGWRFFPEGNAPANIRFEPSVTINSSDLEALGENFEKTSKGFIDFLLLDTKGFPLIILEAKSEDKNPLVGKEQARKYAKSQNCRFVILSNGNLHYFWDLERGNPYLITPFPTPDSVIGYQQVTPNPQRLIEDQVGRDYIVLTQRPNYASEAAWKNENERSGYELANKLRFLRPYQLKAIHTLQRAVTEGKDRFLFEMATGTGKTLTAAAVIKLFLRSGNARRVLFLVDRLELEDQARKAFKALLSADFQTVIYKENRDDWRRAEIVVTTVQSLLFNNKYQRLFSPTDFDLVISDEAHRSIGGNARAVFDYFIGYKLGLTATPRDYLRRFDKTNPSTRDPREAERRLLLDTYRTFGCENSQPTYRYSLLDGVKEGYHMLTMSFVYFNIWQIRQARPEDFQKGLIGFGKDIEKKLLEATSPFVFSAEKERSILRFLKLIGCDNGKIGTYVKLVDDRNETAHPNGNIFFSTQAALDAKITEILRVVDEIQTHSKCVIEDAYREFLLQNHDPEEREYPDAADQIREVLIHENYLSQKDIDICLGFNLTGIADRPEIDSIRTLHEVLKSEYGPDDERGES